MSDCKASQEEYRLTLHGPEQFFWQGSEAGLLKIYHFPGIQAGDGSEEGARLRMGAGVWCWHKQVQQWGLRVGRERECSNFKRPEFSELAAIASFLRSIDRTCPCVYLCDNAAVLKEIQGWVGERGRTSLAKCTDADILEEILQILHQRVQAEAATILTKVKSHRSEPMNEYADAAGSEGRQAPDDSVL